MANKKKYEKILNNLLDIKGREQSIFTIVRGSNSFDVNSKFSPLTAKKILKQKEFSIHLKENDLQDLLKKIEKETSAAKIIKAYEDNKEMLFASKKAALKKEATFKDTKKELIDKLKLKIKESKKRWNVFNRVAIDENIRENIWPLHVGTLFVKLKTEKREVYAPLILKEVTLKVTDSSLILKSEGDWRINEKLLFAINQEKFNLKEEMILNDLTGLEAVEKVAKEYGLDILKKDLSNPFSNIARTRIKNETIEVETGVVLGLFKPSGGVLRKTMHEIIRRKEVESLILDNVDKEKYQERVEKIVTLRNPILRIQPSNFSQDKATISSLIQDTIIWGPPGTGKSQTIANILANILFYKKKALVTSQKKAALDVLKKRMGTLSKYVLFILNDNNFDKSEFYKTLQDFINSVENSKTILDRRESIIITSNEIEKLKFINKAKEENKYSPSVKFIEKLTKDVLDKEFEIATELISKLPSDLIYPELKGALNELTFFEETMALNGIEKKGGFLINWFPKKVKNAWEVVSKIMNIKLKANDDDLAELLQATGFETIKKGFRSNINELVALLKHTDVKTIINLYKCSDIKPTKTSFESAERYLDSIISNDKRKQIENWKQNNKEKYEKYLKFSETIKKARSLPYKFINNFSDIIKELFQVVITTPQTGYVEWEKHAFDYAIIDESSQMFLEVGLPIIFLAKNHILAGDPEQMKPSRWFAARDEDEDSENLFEKAESLLDYGLEKGMYGVMLDKNYRSSKASLMSFSAKEFYNSNLDVVNNKDINKSKAIEVFNVNGEWKNSINVAEANKVIELAKENISKYETIIILTFNSRQKDYITDRIIGKHKDLFRAMKNGKISLGNIENIQGDEADLVIASVVYDETTHIGSTYIARQGGRNALNVAISRAKEKMMVVKSVTSETVKVGKSQDFLTFKKWLEFLDLNDVMKTAYSNSSINDKGTNLETANLQLFEDMVVNSLEDKVLSKYDFKIVKNYNIGSRQIDIALIEKETKKYKIGFELDTYEYHEKNGFDKYLQDISRHEYIQSKGYKVYRIKEIKWKIDPEKTINNILEILNSQKGKIEDK